MDESILVAIVVSILLMSQCHSDNKKEVEQTARYEMYIRSQKDNSNILDPKSFEKQIQLEK